MPFGGKITLSREDVPLGAYLTCSLLDVNFSWGEATSLVLDPSCTISSGHTISRHVARSQQTPNLYPSNVLHRTEVDHWLTIASGPLSCRGDLSYLGELNKSLTSGTYLVDDQLTIADLEVYSSLKKSNIWLEKVSSRTAPNNALRWFCSIDNEMKKYISSLPSDVKLVANVASKSASSKKDEGGKFVELPGAKMGEVVVRFPPEASGYLHIGHAKAALLNQHYQKLFKGKLIMRFDDTNPAKEKADFEKVILEDVKLLEIEPDMFTHTSDHFDRMIKLCEDLIQKGLAYADDTDAETMKKEREERKESVNRSNTVQKNMSMWQEMKKGTDAGQTCCIRAKIDMQSNNGSMRDPAIYRCKNETHIKTGNKYKVYPTYDFACPIVDSVEGVTHALRTTEYHDRDDQYFWFIEKLNLRPVHIYEYSRLNMNNTVLSKRKLTWFVEQGLVDGWDDPRFPTVRGILRKGMTIEGLKEFIIAQGSSRSVVNMEWDKIWSFNKKVLDRDASRYTALEGDLIPVYISGVKEELKQAQKHPKDPSKGMKNIWMSGKVFVESVDAQDFQEGTNVTFINWGNMKVKAIKREGDKVVSVEAEPNLENTDFKKTLKVTWLAESKSASWTPLVCLKFGHLINKSVLGKDEDFKQFIGHETKTEYKMLGDTDLKSLKVGEIIQLQRKGFFRVDAPYKPFDKSSCQETPMVVIAIPDGHTKESTGTSKKADLSLKESIRSSEGKAAEKSPQVSPTSDNVAMVNSQIVSVGNKIRKLKADKADKSVIKAEVDTLLALKADFKRLTNMDWKPDMDVSSFAPTKQTSMPSASEINNKIQLQGDKVRSLKASKADKNTVKAEVDVLLALKKEFKDVSGLDWKPDMSSSSKSTAAPQSKTNSVVDINNKIKEQGDKVRSLKGANADKETIKAEVATLLSLKKEFKEAAGLEWKPDVDLSSFGTQSDGTSAVSKTETNNSVGEIHEKIKAQGDKVRSLKSAKAAKDVIAAEVKSLLSLKEDFKKASGMDWKPDLNLSSSTDTSSTKAPNSGSKSALDIHESIKVQGDKVRSLKSSKADKNVVKDQVDVLLGLKKEFHALTGLDWKPDIDISTFNSGGAVVEKSDPGADLNAQIKQQGDKIRALKSSKADKDVIKAEVDVLLTLKANYKNTTGSEWKPEGGSAPTRQSAPPSNSSKKAKPAPTPKPKQEESSGKKQTRLGMEFKKADNLPEWYSQVITKAEMIEYYNVSGCYILRPWSYAIWEVLKNFFDDEIKKLGVENGYFPLFISKEALEREKSHIEGFSPEVAWVTKSGDSEMAEPIAIRPTSETVMYPAYAKWIQSHRDLPLRINQWNNIVRWEFKQATPFLRTREFLWQEGHTAFAEKKEAEEEVHTMIDLYERIYEEYLAVPVVKGRKTEKEKFAGGDFTTTTEAFISTNGRAIQGATSHHLGQIFSKMFDISFEDPKTLEKQFVYQNSWGFTTRTIGVMVMVHGDDKGIVLPPKVAPVQVIILPVGITAKTTPSEKDNLIEACNKLKSELTASGVRAKCDLKENVTPAWKFNHWELKGVPLRIELGPREVANKQVFAVRRDNGEKQGLARDTAVAGITDLLKVVQDSMFSRAKEELNTHKVVVKTWDDFMTNLDKKNLMLTPFCGDEGCEDKIKKDSTREIPVDATAPSMGAKSLCIPFKQPGTVEGCKCIYPGCPAKPKFYTLFGRSY